MVTRRGCFPRRAAEPASVEVADSGGLTGEDETSAGLEDTKDLTERLLDVRNVVQHGVADHQVEGVVLVRNGLGIGNTAVDRKAEAFGIAQCRP